MSEITLYFKNKLEITFLCTRWELEKNKMSGRFTRCVFDNPKPYISFDLNELVAVVINEDAKLEDAQ